MGKIASERHPTTAWKDVEYHKDPCQIPFHPGNFTTPELDV
jgi:hypothetical protein